MEFKWTFSTYSFKTAILQVWILHRKGPDLSTSQPGLDPWAVQLRIGERDARHALGAVLGPAPGRVLRWADGVLPSTTAGGMVVDLRVVGDDPAPSMSLRSYPGQCVISRDGQGPYICTLDQTGRVTLDDADPANARIDLVVARIWDERIGDPLTGFAIEPVTGVAAPEPSPPEVPAGAIPLARVPVPPGATQIDVSTLTDLRRAAHIRGGVGVLLPGDDPADLGAYAGQTRYRGSLESFDGEQWRGGLRLAALESTDLVARNGEAGVAALTSVAVPDPGWPYRLLVNGSAELSTSNCRADLNIRLDSVDGTTVAIGGGPDSGTGHVVTQTRVTEILSGPHTLYLCGVRVFGEGTWSNTAFVGSLTALTLPA